ncbi:hypothetical protein ACFLQV_00015 [Calditrichota bacterium]
MNRHRLSYFFPILLILSGCAGTRFQKSESAGSMEEAFQLLANQQQTLSTLEARVTLKATLPQGNYSARGTLKYDRQGGTLLTVNGPMGVSIGELQIFDDRAVVSSIFGNKQEEYTFGKLDYVPELGMDIGFLGDVSKLLLPVLSFTDPGDWAFGEGKEGDPGYIFLNSREHFGKRVMILMVNTDPVQLQREDLMENGRSLISRSILFDPEDANVPSQLIMQVENYSLQIFYTWIKVSFEDSQI